MCSSPRLSPLRWRQRMGGLLLALAWLCIGDGQLLLLGDSGTPLIYAAADTSSSSSSSSSSTGGNDAGSAYDGRWVALMGPCSVTCGQGLRYSSLACVLAADGSTMIDLSRCNATAAATGEGVPTTGSHYCNAGACPEQPVLWRNDGRCGTGWPAPEPTSGVGNGTDAAVDAQCNPAGTLPCCSSTGWCGSTVAECDCASCIDYARLAGLNRTTGGELPPGASKSNAASVLVVALSVIAALLGTLFLVWATCVAVRWRRRRKYLEARQKQQRPGVPHIGGQLQQPAHVVASSADSGVFGPVEAEAAAAAAAAASSSRKKSRRLNSVAPAPLPLPAPVDQPRVSESPSSSPSASTSLSSSSSSLSSSPSSAPPALPRLHLHDALAVPSSSSASLGLSSGRASAAAQLSPSSSFASPAPSPRLAISPRDVALSSTRGAAPDVADEGASNRSLPTSATMPVVLLHVRPDVPSPSSPSASSSSGLDLLDRTQQLTFGRRPQLAPLSSASAGSVSASSPPRLRGPLRHGALEGLSPTRNGSSAGQRLVAAGVAAGSPAPSPSPSPSSPGGLSPAARRVLEGYVPPQPAMPFLPRLPPLGGRSMAAADEDEAAGLPQQPAGLQCSICLSAAADGLVHPCGHSSFCYTCATRWCSGSSNGGGNGAASSSASMDAGGGGGGRCPVCRVPVEHVVRLSSKDVARRDAAIARAEQQQQP